MKPVLITGVKEQIKSIVDELRCIEVEAIYLFGSYAKGNAKPISDIDISVITKRNVPKNIKEKIRGEDKGCP